ncbi:hypothetical protein D3C84_536780 [compost metagenome]
MILYKYMSPDVAQLVLERNSIAFSIASEFNDPFETVAGYPIRPSNPIEEKFDGIRSWAARLAWTENSGVLSLTRTPTNPLMWAHYATEHRGLVLGFDADVAGFTDETTCLIPAQHGSIVYTQTRPTSPFSKAFSGAPISVGHTHSYPVGHHEKLSRLFLQKPMCWSYEEEVRVVKCIADRNDEGINASGKFKLIEANGRRLYCYQLPDESVKEIYIGLRHQALISEEAFANFRAQMGAKHPDAEIKACSLSNDSWGIEIVSPYQLRS